MPKKNNLENKNDNEMVNFYNHKKMKEFLTEYHNPNIRGHGIKVPFRMAVIAASGGCANTSLSKIENAMLRKNTFDLNQLRVKYDID